MTGAARVGEAAFLAWLLLSLPHSARAGSIRQRVDKIAHSAGAGSIRQRFDTIAEAAQRKTGLDQITEINLSVNILLNTTHFFLKSPETDRWRSVDYILESKYRDDCKDYVVLKEELLRRVGIESERILVMVRSSGELHVVLKIHYGEREIVLDNLREVLVTMEDLRDTYVLYGGAP